MKNVTLLGVIHGETSNKKYANILSGSESDIFFKQKFKSFDEKDTLLIVEGDYSQQIISNTDYQYERKLKRLSKALLESDYGPDILFADIRMRNLKNWNKHILKFVQLENWAMDNVGLHKTAIESLNNLNQSDILDAIKNRRFLYSTKFLKEPDLSIRRLAKDVLAIHDDMEKYMYECAQKYSTNYEQVLIITGASHSLDMNVKMQIPVEILFKQGDITAENMYLSFIVIKEIPRIITERYPL